LYAALTGVIPEDGLARAMDNAQLTPIRKRNPDVSRRLASVIEKAMEVDPGDRFQTAEEFKTALLNSKSKTQQLLGTYTVSPPPSAEERISDPEKTEMALIQPAPQEEYAFVSPRKKQLERNRRLRRILVSGLMAFLLVGFFSVAYFFPNLLPVSARRLFPFMPVVEPTAIPTEIVAPIVPATQVPTELTPLVVTATPDQAIIETQTALSVIDPNVVATPIGGDYLQIAYSSLRTGVAQIYLTNILSDQAIAITNMPGGACQASWSPDGKQLVFISPCNIKKDIYPQSSLYIVNADGSDPLVIQSGVGGDFEPAWSPDGKQIAFTSLRDGYMQIYSYNVVNKNVKRLVETPVDKYARQPSWSPDGKHIVYAYRRIDTYEIWTMTSDGEEEKQLLPSGNKVSNYQPVWSFDGSLILYSQQSATEFTFPNLFSISANGDTKPIQIFLGVLSIEDVKYSPDGVWIAYESGSERGYHVYYSTLSGANQARITEDVTFDDFDPAWRPRRTAP
jgi:Tol biopolymer transport system component